MKKNIGEFKNLKLKFSKKKENYIKKNIKIFIDEIKDDFVKRKNVFHVFNKDYQFNTKNLEKFKKLNSIIIIGMGGSILGTKAIYEFLKHKIKKQVYFIDNLEVNKFKEISLQVNLKKSLFLIISKSGETLETLSIINSFSKVKFNKNNTIIITENKKSSLKLFAAERKIHVIDHKKYISGRYSVLSEVGMIPSFLMGLKIIKFRKKLLSFLKNDLRILKKNVTDLSRAHLTKNFKSIIFLSYSPELNEFVYWCQQLISESLGKKGKGLLPILSKAPKDYHSLLQLYLAGPKDKLFYIIDFKRTRDKTIKNLFKNKESILRKKSLNKIVQAQKISLIKTFNELNIPFREISIKDQTESSLGEIFSYFIFETFLIGKLMNINPFDQPAVEKIKETTRKILL